jgi:hypothetical protein
MNQEDTVKRRKTKGSKSKDSRSDSFKKSKTNKSKKKVDESIEMVDVLEQERKD